MDLQHVPGPLYNISRSKDQQENHHETVPSESLTPAPFLIAPQHPLEYMQNIRRMHLIKLPEVHFHMIKKY